MDKKFERDRGHFWSFGFYNITNSKMIFYFYVRFTPEFSRGGAPKNRSAKKPSTLKITAHRQ